MNSEKYKEQIVLWHLFIVKYSGYHWQISNASILYHPSFAGSKNGLRIGLGSSYRGPERNNDKNYFVSIDAPIKKISGAFGISSSYSNCDWTVKKFNDYSLNLTYAQIFTIRNNERAEIISIRPALSLNYYKNDLKYRPFDDYDLDYQPIEINTEVLRLTPSILITGKKYFVGAKYKSSLLSGCRDFIDNKFKIGEYYYFNVIGGYTFQRKPESKFSFTPIIAFQFDKYFTERNKDSFISYISVLDDINLTFKYGKLLTGFNLYCLLLGYQSDKLRVCLSLVPTTNLAYGELSLNYIFKKDKR